MEAIAAMRYESRQLSQKLRRVISGQAMYSAGVPPAARISGSNARAARISVSRSTPVVLVGPCCRITYSHRSAPIAARALPDDRWSTSAKFA